MKLNLSLHDYCSSVGETVRLPIGSASARLLILTAILQFCVTSAQADFHLSLPSKDTNPGAKRAPFVTLERARDAVRALQQTSGLPVGGVTIWIHQGDYPLTRGFSLTKLGSGEPGRPIVYRAASGEEVRLLGGRGLPDKAFHPVTIADVRARLDAAD